MSFSNGLTTIDILDAFSEQMAIHQGTVTDSYNDGSRLFARGVIPRADEVQPGDRLQAGVAIRAGVHDVCLHPYVFRLVCKNGAIMAQTVQSRVIGDFYELASDEALANLREAVTTCCATNVFTDAVLNIRSAIDRQADSLINLMPMISHIPEPMRGRFLQQIIERFFDEGDRSQFGLMNAVTSVARDTANPEARWNLEELGGAIPILARDIKPRPHRPVAARRNHDAPVGVA